MTATIAVETRPFEAGIRLPSLPGILRWLVAVQRRHRERLQLAEMDDAALQDIGLSRGDVMAEIRKPRWQR